MYTLGHSNFSYDPKKKIELVFPFERRLFCNKCRTSKNPSMKLDGNLLSPRKFSSLKYDMTCVVCFQKFIISCGPIPSAELLSRNLSIPVVVIVCETSTGLASYLVFGIVLHNEDVDNGELVDKPVPLKLLTHPGSESGYRKRDIVHGSDLGSLLHRTDTLVMTPYAPVRIGNQI